MCYDAIDRTISDGFVPIVAGGTGLYINAVVNNVDFFEVDEEKTEAAEEMKNLSERKNNGRTL